MTNRDIFIVLLLQISICVMVAKCSLPCIIYNTKANCIKKSLHEVPPLPKDVTHVDLTLNYIGEISVKSFFGLEALQILILQQQEIKLVLKNDAFIGLSNLRVLDLKLNKFLQLEPGAFNGLFNLQKLTLTQCNLNDSILSGDYLKPLVSLEELMLDKNAIHKLKPAPFFLNMTNFHTLDLSYNSMTSTCEDDLRGFQGKHFNLLKLTNILLSDMHVFWPNWTQCGNPFKNMSITALDLSQNSFSVDMALLFFKAISGTKIYGLSLKQSSSMGRGVAYYAMKDPDKDTFKDLAKSGITILNLSKCRIFAVTYSLFVFLPDLEQVTLASNLINEIKTDAFLGAAQLKMLNLSYNLLDKIDSGTFKNLENLEVLDLSYNNLRIFLTDAFKGLSNLLSLDLTENSLQSVHSLAALPQLQELYLGSNKIKSLYDLPRAARNIIVLDLHFNRLNNAEEIYKILVEFPNIEKLYIQSNIFSFCYLNSEYPVSPSNKLQILNLGTTGFQNLWTQGLCLDVFDNLHQLRLLSLENNYIQSLPNKIFNGLSSLLYLDLSFNSLTYIPNGMFPESLRLLNLEHNYLGSVDPHALSRLDEISLEGNRFLCDCGLKDFQIWLNQTRVHITAPITNLICEFPEEQRGIPLIHSVLCEDLDDEENIEKLRLTLFICCTASILIFIITAVIFIHLRGYCFNLYRKVVIRFVDRSLKSPADDGFLYDLYLCFSLKDIKWVEKALLKKLDTQFSEHNQFRCCFEARDFLPGEDHLSNMRNAVWNSKKVLCVVSREFLNDGWCLEAFTLAQSKMLEEVQEVLLVLIVENIPQYRLMKFESIRTYIQTRRYLCWPEDSQDLEWFYNQLKKSILKDSKSKKVKVNPETMQKETDIEAVTAF